MKRSNRWRVIVLGASAALLIGLYGTNASWLVAPPSGVPRVVAQRGVAQQYRSVEPSDAACTARLILPPAHSFIDNTAASIDAARAAGADVVEIDVRITKDRQFVLFHDGELACRTEGSGPVSEHSVAELKALDVGYGYTADQGRSFPLRGRGVGLMPTLAEVLNRFPQQRFLVQIKDGGRDVADSLVAYLGSDQLEPWSRLSFFGSAAPVRRLHEIVPTVRTWTAGDAGRCAMGYILSGWYGHVPRTCDDGIIIVPIEQTGFLWGWPNRFLARMREHHTEVMLIGRVQSLTTGQFVRLDTVDELARVPAGFDGAIWTDRVGVIGPAVRHRGSSAK